VASATFADVVAAKQPRVENTTADLSPLFIPALPPVEAPANLPSAAESSNNNSAAADADVIMAADGNDRISSRPLKILEDIAVREWECVVLTKYAGVSPIYKHIVQVSIDTTKVSNTIKNITLLLYPL
jgi:hypothetical protein